MNKSFFSDGAAHYRQLSVILDFLFILFIATFLFFTDFNKLLILFVQDDSFYYFKIAENFIYTGKFTFDGLSATNGFQPLWQLIVIIIFYPAYYLFKLSAINKVNLVLFIQAFLIFASFKLLVKRLRNFFQLTAIIFVINYFLLEFFYGYFSGMESALLFFFYSALFCYCIDKKFNLPDSSANYFFIGLLTGLIILTRLDQIFLVSAFLICTFISKDFSLKNRLNRALKLSVGFMLLFAPYATINLIYTSNIIPISGMLKSGFPNLHFSLDFIISIVSSYTIAALISIPFFIFFVLLKKDLSCKVFYGISTIFCITMLSHFLYSVFFMKWGIFGWHFSIYVFFGLLFFLPTTEFLFLKLKSKSLYYLIIIVFIALNLWIVRDVRRTYAYGKSQGENHWHIQSVNAALWAKYNTPPETIFAMSDAGTFSFFSERQVVNLDGLVNNLEYQEALKNYTLYSYLKNRNVKYIVHHAVWDKEDVINNVYSSFTKYYPSHLYEGTGDSLILKKEDEVYRSMPYYDGSHKAVFIIWKLE